MPEQLTQRVLSVIAATQRISPERVTIDSSFQDLGIDSMDGLNILFALENEFDITIPDKQADHIDRFAQFAVIAAREAVEDSGVELDPEARESAAIVTGSCVGGQSSEDAGFVELYQFGRPRVSPLTIAKTMANAGASHISMEFGITGPAYTISTACSSSNHAIGQAFWMVRSGGVEVAITGGSEAVFSMGFLKAWEAMRVVSQDTCRPFSKDRSGMILGEGGAMLVLEPLERALARGARVHAEIGGCGVCSEAGH